MTHENEYEDDDLRTAVEILGNEEARECYRRVGRFLLGLLYEFGKVLGAMVFVVGVSLAFVGAFRCVALLGVREVPQLLPHRLEYVAALGIIAGYWILRDGGSITPPRWVQVLCALLGVGGSFLFTFMGAGLFLPAVGLPVVP